MDIQKIIETASALSIPFLAKFSNLPIFFTNWKDTYVISASLIASALYAYIRYTNPNSFIFPIGSWWIFLVLSALLIIGYIALYAHNHATTKPSMLITGLTLFIALYVCVIVTFSFLFQTFDYQLVKCKVVESEKPHTPIAGATFTFYFTNADNNGEHDELPIGTPTNDKGILQRYFSNEKLKSISFYDVIHENYRNILARRIDMTGISDLQHIQMTR